MKQAPNLCTQALPKVLRGGMGGGSDVLLHAFLKVLNFLPLHVLVLS